VLAVGGGGSGGSYTGGGGGGGGVAMQSVLIPASSNQTITLSVGTGGATTSNAQLGNTGSNTSIIFNGTGANITTPSYITAYGGGGGGGTSSNTSGSSGGSGGGGCGFGTAGTGGGSANTNGINYANMGANTTNGGSLTGSSGGGGAGGVGFGSIVNGATRAGGPGGKGIQCFLPGINQFIISNKPVSMFYWAGVGGGSCDAGNIEGNGGFGGGGGGGTQGTGTPGILDTNGINNSSSGISGGAGGAGGINTGGGGGGDWNISTGGAGGSGIVVIAFPQTAILSNQSAVLPNTLVSSGQYNAVLNNASLTTGAYNSTKGAFACKLLNYNYFGPVMTLRHSLDTTGTYTVNFYADVCGNVGTGYLGTGLSVYNWLSGNGANTNYAYVTKWYNQGMDVSFNSATQYVLGSQPVYEVATGVINYGYTTGYTPGTNLPSWSANAGNAYFNLPNGALPFNDASYNYTATLGKVAQYVTTQPANINSSVVSGGTASSSRAFTIAVINSIYFSQWYTTGQINFGSWTSSQGPATITTQYGGALIQSYVNSTFVSSANASARLQDPVSNYIGYSTIWSPYNGQLYNLFVFQSNLNSADRQLVEATPYLYTAPATITGLLASSVTATTFVLSWTSFNATATYALWINGFFYANYNAGTGTLTTGTVTPGAIGTGPWTLNLYAYNTTSGLLASGTTYALPMIMWYKFNSADQTGSTVYNFATGAYDATLNTSCTISTTQNKYGGASLFNNGGSGCSLPAVTFNGTTGMSIVFWTYITSYSAGTPPFSLKFTSSSTMSANSGQLLRPWFNGTTFIVDTDSTDVTISGTNVTLSNTWVHMAYVFSGTSINLYINGNYYGNANFHATLQNLTYASFVIGTDININGAITAYFDDFRVYNYQLTSLQVNAVYNSAGN
jgi:hypothetical protein